MRHIFNLQKSCIIKYKATGVPDYNVLNKNNTILVIQSKQDLFTRYEQCKKNPQHEQHKKIPKYHSDK